MREELRRRLPRTQGCGIAIAAGILVVVVIVVYVVWHFTVADKPSKMVKAVMAAARRGDVQAMRGYLTPESLRNPSCDQWLGQLAIALGRRATLSRADILGDRAVVHVTVKHRSGAGEIVGTDVGVHAVRSEEGWLIDLEPTIASASHQFWTALAAEGR